MRQRLNPGQFTEHTGNLCVDEAEPDGELQVIVSLPNGSRAWGLPFNPKGWSILKSQKNADGMFLVARQDGAVTALIVECKRTLTKAQWEAAREQMRWSLHRLRGLAGLLGVTVGEVRLVAAFVEDRLTDGADPIACKSPIGGEGRRSTVAEWRSRRLMLAGFTAEFRLDALQAAGDPLPIASYTLP